MDAITHEARYSLSEDRLLREAVAAKTVREIHTCTVKFRYNTRLLIATRTTKMTQFFQPAL